MPTSKIKKDAREGKGTVKSLEKKWDKAKDAAGEKGGKPNYPLSMHIYENMTKSGVELNAATRLMRLQAATPYPGLIKFFQAHDDNITGDPKQRRPQHLYEDDLRLITSHFPEHRVKELNNFFLHLNPKQLAEVSDFALGEKVQTVKIPPNLKQMIRELFEDE